MNKIIRFFTIYPIWTNLIFFGILIFGLLILKQMKFSFFPEVDPEMISVQVTYPGASPEEIEEGVVLKIEEQLEGLEGIDRTTSVSRENFASVSIEVIHGYDIYRALNDVKNAIDRINSFPVGMEKPVVAEQKFREGALSIMLFGNTDRFNLKYIADQFRDELMMTPEMSQITVKGVPKLEISVEVEEEALRKYHLRFDEIARAVRESNINISGGKLDTKDEEILIRGYNRKYFPQEFNDIIVRGKESGNIVYLRDVAKVRERWEDSPERVYYNGKPAISIAIDKTKAEDILAIKDKAVVLVDKFNNDHSGVKAEIIDDRTVPLRQRIQILIDNGLLGLLLVITSLTFFMNLKISAWVSAGIPFSFAGMFIITGLYGMTINIISLFGMIIVVGILVDDAIVVGENIYSHYERGKPPLRSAIDGAVEVFPAVLTSVLTTIIAFIPYFFLEGGMGGFIWQTALVVIASLVFSLIEAFLILPGHLAHSKGLHPHKEDNPVRKRIEKWIDRLTNHYYARALRWTMLHKWFTIAMPIAFVLIVVGLFRGGFIRATFFPFIDGDTMPVNISLIPGTQESVTDSILARIESFVPAINRKFAAEREDGEDVVIATRREIGKNDLGETGSHAGKLTLQLLDGEKRNMESFYIANALRNMIGPVYEAEKITFGRASMFGRAISISLLGNDIAALKDSKEQLKIKLGEMSELKDITDSDQEGLRELRLHLKPKAYALGLTLSAVAGQVRQGFFGLEIQRLQRGRDEIRVWARYDDKGRNSLNDLRKMRIRTAQGQSFPFEDLATFNIERGLIKINHLDRQREIKVEADMNNPEGDVGALIAYIQSNILPEILAQHSSVHALFEGQSRSAQKTGGSAAKAFPLALIGIVIIMILVFRSYAQALLVFGLIPLGIIGAIVGHGLHGIPVNMLSLFGIIALAGIMVNDSIVFIDQINRNLRLGQDVNEAIFNSGISRLRPILLTTFTTVLGLGPLILETSRQAQFLIPMAISVAYGLIFTTMIILIVLPSAFLILNRFRILGHKLLTGEVSLPRGVEPAVRELSVVESWKSEGKNV